MAANHPITLTQGDTWHFDCTIETDGVAWNISDYEIRIQVRESSFSTVKFLDLKKSTGEITGNSVGQVSATATSAMTQEIPVGRHVWDLELTSSGGERTTLLTGPFVVEPGVTN